MVFCTVFDSNYLDKGITLYQSLAKVCTDFKLYILAMDERCWEILQKLNYDNVTVVRLGDFVVREDLIEIQRTRIHSEFCWTCSSHFVHYVLTEYGEKLCTYIDADMYFYSDPQILVDEMCDRSVQIIPHWFNDSLIDRMAQKNSGFNCVEFDSFKNDKDGMELLEWWKQQCRANCSSNSDGKVFGDQFYLDELKADKRVSVISNRGAGLAPWNIAQYSHSRKSKDLNTEPVVVHRRSHEEYRLIFFHFHSLRYLSETSVNIGVFVRHLINDKDLIMEIYLPYLRQIAEVRRMLLDTYGWNIGTRPIQIKAEVQLQDNHIKRLIKAINKKGIGYTLLTGYCFVADKFLRAIHGDKDILTF